MNSHDAFLRDLTEGRRLRVRGCPTPQVPFIIPLAPETAQRIHELKAARLLGSWSEDGHYIPPDPEAVEQYDAAWKQARPKFRRPTLDRYRHAATQAECVYRFVLAQGKATRHEIAQRLGITNSAARAAAERLFRSGKLDRKKIKHFNGYVMFEYFKRDREAS